MVKRKIIVVIDYENLKIDEILNISLNEIEIHNINEGKSYINLKKLDDKT